MFFLRSKKLQLFVIKAYFLFGLVHEHTHTRTQAHGLGTKNLYYRKHLKNGAHSDLEILTGEKKPDAQTCGKDERKGLWCLKALYMRVHGKP